MHIVSVMRKKEQIFAKAKSLASLALLGLTTFGEVAQAAIPTGCGQTIGSGSIGAYYDFTTEMVTIEAVIPDGSYAGWGWGSSMTDTEMVIFETGASAGVTFYDGTGETTPTEDTAMSPCYTTSFSLDGTTYTMTATRPLDCTSVIGDAYLI